MNKLKIKETVKDTVYGFREKIVEKINELIEKEECISFACSDETTAIAAATNTIKLHAPYSFKLKGVFAGLSTPQTSGSIFTIDVNKNGVSVLSTKLTIDNTEATSITAATSVVISTVDFVKGDEISVDVDQIGDGTATGLKVYLNVKR